MNTKHLSEMKEESSVISTLFENVKIIRKEMPDETYAGIFKQVGEGLGIKQIGLLANVLHSSQYPQVVGQDMLGGSVNSAYSFIDKTAAVIIMAGGKFEIHTFDSLLDIQSGVSNESGLTKTRKLKI